MVGAQGEGAYPAGAVPKKTVGAVRAALRWNARTSFCKVDALGVMNTYAAGRKDYGAGKKVPVTKRHIAMDVGGFPHAWRETTANVTDRAGAIGALECARRYLTTVENGLVDGGYGGE